MSCEFVDTHVFKSPLTHTHSHKLQTHTVGDVMVRCTRTVQSCTVMVMQWTHTTSTRAHTINNVYITLSIYAHKHSAVAYNYYCGSRETASATHDRAHTHSSSILRMIVAWIYIGNDTNQFSVRASVLRRLRDSIANVHAAGNPHCTWHSTHTHTYTQATRKRVRANVLYATNGTDGATKERAANQNLAPCVSPPGGTDYDDDRRRCHWQQYTGHAARCAAVLG